MSRRPNLEKNLLQTRAFRKKLGLIDSHLGTAKKKDVLKHATLDPAGITRGLKNKL